MSTDIFCLIQVRTRLRCLHQNDIRQPCMVREAGLTWRLPGPWGRLISASNLIEETSSTTNIIQRLLVPNSLTGRLSHYSSNSTSIITRLLLIITNRKWRNREKESNIFHNVSGQQGSIARQIRRRTWCWSPRGKKPAQPSGTPHVHRVHNQTHDVKEELRVEPSGAPWDQIWAFQDPWIWPMTHCTPPWH